MQQNFPKYHEHDCVAQYFLRVISRSQKMVKPYSPVETRIVRLCEEVAVLFTHWISGELDYVLPLHNSMQHFRLECNHNRKQKVLGRTNRLSFNTTRTA
jgi:hypothetical protein